MLGLIFKSTTNAIIFHFYISILFLVTSGAILNIVDTTNPFLVHLRDFSPMRFATEQFLRQVMDSNSDDKIDEYCESFGFKFKI